MQFVDKRLLYFLRKLCWQYKVYVIFMMVASLMWAIDLTFKPMALKILLDNQFYITLKMAEQSPKLFPLFFYFSCILTSVCFFRFYDYFIYTSMLPSMHNHIKSMILKRVLSFDYQYHTITPAVKIIHAITQVSNHSPIVIEILLFRLPSYIFAVMLSMLVVSNVAWFFSIIIFIWVVVFVVITRYHAPMLYYWGKNFSQTCENSNFETNDILTNIALVISHGTYRAEQERLNRANIFVQDSETLLNKTSLRINIICSAFFVVIQLVCISLLLWYYEILSLSLGDIALIFSINTAIVVFLWDLTSTTSRLMTSIGEICYAMAVLDYSPKKYFNVCRKPKDNNHFSTTYDISCQNVSVLHHNTQSLFENLSINIPLGQKIAIIGPSGSGKSSFAKLLTGLFPHYMGKIYIGKKDLEDIYPISSFITYVSQDIAILNRNFIENIGYGTSISRQTAIDAAKYADAHDFICKKYGGYDSIISKDKLSGGEKQKVAFARAVARNTPIIILDEVTSMLDFVSENILMDRLHRYAANKTLIFITHKPPKSTDFDRILVFERGKIIEDGSHKQLSSFNGYYKALCRHYNKDIL